MAKIVDISLAAVVQEKPEYSWSPLMPEVLNTDTLVRVRDADGYEGFSSVCTFTEYGPDHSVVEGMRSLCLGLLKAGDLSAEEHWTWMQGRRPGVSDVAIAGLDIALWDLAARRAGQPLHRLLGGTRDAIPVYASMPIMDGPDDYIAMITDLAGQGIRGFKFHYKSVPDIDAALIEAVAAAFSGQGLEFMFDAEGQYDAPGAAKVAKLMAEHGFVWLEAPFDDHDWAAYLALKDSVDLDIIPAGNSVVAESHLDRAIEAGCWSALRLDTATASGITPVRRIFEKARAAGLNLELQSWGSSISTAANLQLALAFENSSTFEVPVPRSDFAVPGCSAFEIIDGTVAAPTKPGLGLEVDWEQVKKASSLVRKYSLTP
ncbi:MAG: enolase C-terminal domain-like protein [Pseudomonadota bacterium]